MWAVIRVFAQHEQSPEFNPQHHIKQVVVAHT